MTDQLAKWSVLKRPKIGDPFAIELGNYNHTSLLVAPRYWSCQILLESDCLLLKFIDSRVNPPVRILIQVPSTWVLNDHLYQYRVHISPSFENSSLHVHASPAANPPTKSAERLLRTSIAYSGSWIDKTKKLWYCYLMVLPDHHNKETKSLPESRK